MIRFTIYAKIHVVFIVASPNGKCNHTFNTTGIPYREHIGEFDYEKKNTCNSRFTNDFMHI